MVDDNETSNAVDDYDSGDTVDNCKTGDAVYDDEINNAADGYDSGDTVGDDDSGDTVDDNDTGYAVDAASDPVCHWGIARPRLADLNGHVGRTAAPRERPRRVPLAACPPVSFGHEPLRLRSIMLRCCDR
jgi:hypothetical protein